MSRVIPFPHLTDSSEETQDTLLFEAEEAWIKDSEFDDEIESGSDPSKWGVPRAFFVVQTPVERPVDHNTAG